MNRAPLKKLVRSAAVAAAYVVLSFISPSIGALQCRVSEALCVLPFLLPEAVPGLFVGCLLSNMLLGAALPDVIFGSLTTLLAGLITCYAGKKKWPPFLAPLPPVLLNAAIVGFLVWKLYEPALSLPVVMLQVGGGEAISCYVLGLPLLYAVQKRRKLLEQ